MAPLVINHCGSRLYINDVKLAERFLQQFLLRTIGASLSVKAERIFGSDCNNVDDTVNIFGDGMKNNSEVDPSSTVPVDDELDILNNPSSNESGDGEDDAVNNPGRTESDPKSTESGDDERML